MAITIYLYSDTEFPQQPVPVAVVDEDYLPTTPPWSTLWTWIVSPVQLSGDADYVLPITPTENYYVLIDNGFSWPLPPLATVEQDDFVPLPASVAVIDEDYAPTPWLSTWSWIWPPMVVEQEFFAPPPLLPIVDEDYSWSVPLCWSPTWTGVPVPIFSGLTDIDDMPPLFTPPPPPPVHVPPGQRKKDFTQNIPYAMMTEADRIEAMDRRIERLDPDFAEPSLGEEAD